MAAIRWIDFDELRFGIKMDEEVTRILQECAYVSPTWYRPWFRCYRTAEIGRFQMLF